MQDEVLSLPDVCAMLQCKEDKASELLVSGQIKATKVGRSWITLKSEVIAFVKREIKK